MKYILVTGSGGLVGHESVDFFIKKGYKIIGIDNNYRKNFFGKIGSISENINNLKFRYNKKYIHYNIDICNNNSLIKIFSKFKKKIKLVIHAAAQPSHDWAKNNIDLDFNINANATLNLLNLMRRFCPKAAFVYVSTNKVYGSNPNNLKYYEFKNRFDIKKKSTYFHGINEKMSLDNTIHSFFGASKLSADIITQEFGKNLNLKTAVFRAGCITGPNHSSVALHGFLNYLIKCNLEKKTYKIIGYKGKQVRDNLHSYDLITAIWQYFKKPVRGEIFNIGGGRQNSCSILEAMEIIQNKTQIKFKTTYDTRARTGDHKWYISNYKKFKSLYPKWKKKYNLDQIIDDIILKIN